MEITESYIKTKARKENAEFARDYAKAFAIAIPCIPVGYVLLVAFLSI